MDQSIHETYLTMFRLETGREFPASASIDAVCSIEFHGTAKERDAFIISEMVEIEDQICGMNDNFVDQLMLTVCTLQKSGKTNQQIISHLQQM